MQNVHAKREYKRNHKAFVAVFEAQWKQQGLIEARVDST